MLNSLASRFLQTLPPSLSLLSFSLTVSSSCNLGFLASFVHSHASTKESRPNGEKGTSNVLDLLEKMNLRVKEEYEGFGDVASGLRVFVEQLKTKTQGYDEYVQQIESIEQQVTEFEAVISVLDRYVSMLESKVQSGLQNPQHQHHHSV